MRHPLFLILLLFALGLSTPVDAQRRARKETKKSMKDQAERKAERKAALYGEYKQKENKHLEMQDKSTRKRMKANRKRQQRMASGKPLPFYKRWFRKKRIR